MLNQSTCSRVLVRSEAVEEQGEAKTIVLTFVAVLVAALLGYLAWIGFLKPDETQSADAVGTIVVDLTGSSNSDVVRTKYQELGNTAIDDFVANQSLVSISYFNNSGAKLASVSNENYPLFLAATDGPEVTPQEQLDENVEAARSTLATTLKLSAGKGRYSDIITALDQAAIAVQSKASAEDISRKYIIIFTDGLQNATELNVVNAAKKDSFDASKQVARAKAIGRLADLEGVTVYFAGVNRGVSATGSQKSAVLENRIEEFWTEYVEAGGGTLGGYTNEYTQFMGAK